MTTILVIYHSIGGNNRTMATAITDGIRSVEGAKAVMKPALEAAVGDLLACDGVVIGSPEYFGYMAGGVKDFFDRTYEQARGDKQIFRKPYAVFVNAGNDGSGALQSIERICRGYQFKKNHEPIIAQGTVTDEILQRCFELGATIGAGCREKIY